jgi:hypothetical protein
VASLRPWILLKGWSKLENLNFIKLVVAMEILSDKLLSEAERVRFRLNLVRGLGGDMESGDVGGLETTYPRVLFFSVFRCY